MSGLSFSSAFDFLRSETGVVFDLGEFNRRGVKKKGTKLNTGAVYAIDKLASSLCSKQSDCIGFSALACQSTCRQSYAVSLFERIRRATFRQERRISFRVLPHSHLLV